MRVTTVTAQVKYSQDTGHGAWKAIELGAEASVDGKETWTEAQASLYQQLGQQLKTLWANGNGHKPQDGAESTIAALPPTEQPNGKSPLPTARRPVQAIPPWQQQLVRAQERR